MDGDTLVFVEVKSRRSTRFGNARASINPAKKRKISMVALGYMKSTGGINRKARFDVIAIDSFAMRGQERIEVIQNAFELSYG